MGRRCLERRYEFCADVDAVLRVSKGLMGFCGALREITPGEKGGFLRRRELPASVVVWGLRPKRMTAGDRVA